MRFSINNNVSILALMAIISICNSNYQLFTFEAVIMLFSNYHDIQFIHIISNFEAVIMHFRINGIHINFRWQSFV